MEMINHSNAGDLTIAAHTIKSLLNIKFSRAKEIHAKAMGFDSSNHLLAELKSNPIERDIDQYLLILKKEALATHQISIDDNLVERLRYQLLD
jgi:hypothetical protein